MELSLSRSKNVGLNNYIQKNGFIPEVLMWETPRINLVIQNYGGVTIGEAIKRLEIDYWQVKKKLQQKLGLIN